MNDCPITQFAVTKRKEVSFTFTDFDKYQYNANGKWPWLQRLLFRMLSKLNARATGSEDFAYVVTVNKETLMDAVHEQVETVWEYGSEPEVIYMGNREFHAIIQDGSIMPEQYGDYSLNIGGLRVEVRPWIKGFFVV